MMTFIWPNFVGHTILIYFFICFNVFSDNSSQEFMIQYLRKTANNIYLLMREHFMNMSGKKKMKAVIVQSKLVDLRKFISP